MSQYDRRDFSGYGGGYVPPGGRAQPSPVPPGESQPQQPSSPADPPPPPQDAPAATGRPPPPPPLPVLPLDYQAPAPAGGYYGTFPPPDARTMAMVCHLLGLLTSVVGPLILWLVKKDDHPFIDHQGREALNFQITVFIAYLVSGFLGCFCPLFPLAVLVGDIVFCVMAMVEANRGMAYRYPVNIRFV
jgi:uncharacterized Tic20 family protein